MSLKVERDATVRDAKAGALLQDWLHNWQFPGVGYILVRDNHIT